MSSEGFSDCLQRFFRLSHGTYLVRFSDVVHTQCGGKFGRLFAEEFQLRGIGFDEQHGGAAFGKLEDFRVTRTNIVFHLNAAFEAELLRSELPR